MTNTKIHLCDTCTKEIPTCGKNKYEYGNGKGNDNIISCSGHIENEDPLIKYDIWLFWSGYAPRALPDMTTRACNRDYVERLTRKLRARASRVHGGQWDTMIKRAKP